MAKEKQSSMIERKIGDVVRLNSGGPAMTVLGYDPSDGETKCAWFNAELQACGDYFPSVCLSAHSPDQ